MRNCKKKGLDYLIEKGLMESYIRIFNDFQSVDILEFTLNSLEEIFLKGSKVKTHGIYYNPYINKFLSEEKGIITLENFMSHPNENIKTICGRVLKKYLSKSLI